MNTVQQYITAMTPALKSIWGFLRIYPIETLVGIVAGVILWKFGIWFLRYWYVSRVKNVYLHITLPREDSQKDKEKEVQKDFKEKIAIMAQCFRSLNELRGLNVMNIIRRVLFHADVVSFEMFIEKKVINFYVVTVEHYSNIVEKQITSFYPNAEIDPVEPYEIVPKGNAVKSYYVHQREPYWFPLKTYKNIEIDPLNTLTNVFTKLEESDTGALQVILRPVGHEYNKRAEEIGSAIFQGRKVDRGGIVKGIPGLGWISSLFFAITMGDKAPKEQTEKDFEKGYVRMLQTKEENSKRIGEKANQTNFMAVIRLVTSAPTEKRAEEIMNSLVVAMSTYNDEGSNGFKTRRVVPLDFINNRIMLRNFRNRVLETRVFGIGEQVNILSEEELSTIYHFPDSKYNFTPSIRWTPYRRLAAPPDMAETGVFLGNNSFRGSIRPVYFTDKDRARHQYIIGKSGSGKSTILSFMIRQDIRNGKGLAVIDPHGDLIEDALLYVPKERAKDVIVFDPGDMERPMGLNILEAKTAEQQDLASSQATEIFIKLFGDEIFGPRIQHYFRNACLTLMEDQEEGATLIDVPRIFVDEAFRKYKVAKIKNPVVLSFWEHEYASTGDREKQEMIPYFSAKFGPFITNTIMRNTIGQPKSAFNIRECMDQGKILLVKLSKGKIGDLNTQLLGLIIVARIQMAAMSRTDMPEEQRRDFYLYVDEFQNFATDSFASILSEARKYRLALIMAHQYISQLVVSKSGAQNTQIRDAVFGNVGTIVAFKVGADDAEYLAKEFAPAVTEQDLVGISNYKAYIKLNINSTTSRPFSLETIYEKTNANSKIAEIVKEYSRMKYGRKREFVDQEITARIGIEIIKKAEEATNEKADIVAPIATTTTTTTATTTPEAAVAPAEPTTVQATESAAPATTAETAAQEVATTEPTTVKQPAEETQAPTTATPTA